ncbi:MAG TPA: sigma-70 family RNA polymerase sigma factor [Gemmatimonadaceae bacterium]
MVGTAPLELAQLLRASTDTVREAAWEELISKHTRLILAVARSFGGGSDDAMDRYAFILEKLREADFRRLRTFRDDAGARFSTWLTVTARRLCLDHHRSVYGRVRNEGVHPNDLEIHLRRKLVEASSGGDIDHLPDVTPSIESATIVRERFQILRQELDKLGARDRLLLTLRFVDNLPASRIASLTAAGTQFSVYHQLNTLLRQLRLALESRGIESLGE